MEITQLKLWLSDAQFIYRKTMKVEDRLKCIRIERALNRMRILKFGAKHCSEV